MFARCQSPLSSPAIDAALEATELRADVYIADARVRQDRRRDVRQLDPAHDTPRIVANPIVGAVAANRRRIEEGEPARQFVALVPVTFCLMQKDWPRLRVPLGRVERPIGQHQLRLAIPDQAQAMPARVRAALGLHHDRRLPIRIQAAGAQPFELFSWYAANAERHVMFPFASKETRA